MTHALVYSILLLFSEIMTRAQRLKIMFRGALLARNHSRVLTEQLSKHLRSPQPFKAFRFTCN